MQKYRIGIVGATGLVGQTLLKNLSNHPYFTVTALSASAQSAHRPIKTFFPFLPPNVASLPLLDLKEDFSAFCDACDGVFVACGGGKSEIQCLEEFLAKREKLVISCNAPHRVFPDVPVVIPELNGDHLRVLSAQKKRLATKRGAVVCKCNCSLQSYLPALFPLLPLGVKKVWVSTYQALSGAGKQALTDPLFRNNLVPFIDGEEEKSEREPLKILGRLKQGKIVEATSPLFSAQCVRVPIDFGHLATVSVLLEKPTSEEEIIRLWKTYSPPNEVTDLPSCPKSFLHYSDSPFDPQAKRCLEGDGMRVYLGRLRKDPLSSYKFIGLSHNLIRGSAGGAIFLAELLVKRGYFDD